MASTALGDYGAAAGFVKTARVANPGDPRLIADLLYYKASAGDIEGAEDLLPILERSIAVSQVDRTRVEWDVLLAADRGLIAFRRGQHDLARSLYAQALDLASANGLREFGASALINLAREEALVSPGIRPDVDALARAIEAFPPPARGAAASFVTRIVESRPRTPRRRAEVDEAPS